MLYFSNPFHMLIHNKVDFGFVPTKLFMSKASSILMECGITRPFTRFDSELAQVPMLINLWCPILWAGFWPDQFYLVSDLWVGYRPCSELSYMPGTNTQAWLSY